MFTLPKIALTVALALGATSASAATRQIDFSVTNLIGSNAPFGLTSGSSVSGSLQFDDSGFSGAGIFALYTAITSLSLTTGTKTWDETDLGRANGYGAVYQNGQIILDAANAVAQINFGVDDAEGGVSISTNNTAVINGSPSNVFVFCNNCVSFAEVPVAAVPLPASAGFLVVALAGLGALGSRRRG